MPYVVTCPKCSTTLKTSQPVPAGRSLTCPQCKMNFTLTEPAPLVDLPTARPAPPARPRREEEVDRPRSRRRVEDEDDDRPRRRPRPVDEDDELPRSRRRRADDDENDDRPPARPRRDEDDLPRVRRGRAADDEDDTEDPADRPRSRKRKKGKSKKGLVLLLGGLAALLFLMCAGGVGFWYFDPFGVFGGGRSEMLAWAPSDSQAVMYMDVEGMAKVDGLKESFNPDRTINPNLGLKTEDVAAVLGAGRGPGDPDVTVVRLRSKADQAKLMSAAGGKEATTGGKKYFKINGGGAVHFASDRLLVVTRSEASMSALLQKDNRVTIPDDLRAATRRADGLVWLVATGSAAEKGDLIGLMAGFGNLFGGLGMGGPGPRPSPPKARTTVFSMTGSGNRGTGRFESTYDSPGTAERVATDLKKMLDQARSKMTDVESFDVSTSGSSVVLKIVGPIKKGKAGLPGLPFGPGGGF